MELIFRVLFFILIATILLGIAVLRSASAPYKLVTIQLLLILFVEAVGLTEIVFNKYYLYNSYLLSELFITSLTAYFLLKKTLIKKATYITLPLLLISWSSEVFLHQCKNFATITFLLSSVLFLGMFIVILYHYGTTQLLPAKQPAFWVCISMIVYYGCNIPIFSFIDYLIVNHHGNPEVLYTVINNSVSILRYMLLAVAFFLILKKPLQSQNMKNG